MLVAPLLAPCLQLPVKTPDWGYCDSPSIRCFGDITKGCRLSMTTNVREVNVVQCGTWNMCLPVAIKWALESTRSHV